jgi:cytochrome c oxidase subunit IV
MQLFTMLWPASVLHYVVNYFHLSYGLDYCSLLLAGMVVQFGIIPDWQNLYFTGFKILFGRATVGKFGPRWVMVEFSPA